jgi:uncharacterized protein (UPF0332 family)
MVPSTVSYNAAFSAAKALLALRDIDAARHSAAISLFQLHFVKPGTIAADLARMLPRAFEKRQNADYAITLRRVPKT